MAVNARNLRIAREYQELVKIGAVEPPMCPIDGAVRLYEVDDEDKILYRCTYCRARYYPPEFKFREMEYEIEKYRTGL